jgi:hypothetical protein
MLCTFKVHSQVININQTFSSDTLFAPFSGTTSVYSLKAYGNINLYSDSSLVRIVLVDSYGNHWLVYELYPLITDTSSFVFTAGCDETCFIDVIIPDSIRVDIINAFLTIDSLKLDTNYIPNATELQAQAKWNNDSVKIAIMNQRIQEEHMYWRAGRTDLVVLFFNEKEKLFKKKYNIAGFDYYMGGIYENLSRRVSAPLTSSIVQSFDWRNRHGANEEESPYYDGDTHEKKLRSGWMTEVRNQGKYCSSCYIFSCVSAVEAYLNLFYNTHNLVPSPHYDINLSEQHILSCWDETSYNNCDGGDWLDILEYMKTTFVVSEPCFPYNINQSPPPGGFVLDCNLLCDNTLAQYDEVKINDYDGLTEGGWIQPTIEQIKEGLITKGPLVSGYVPAWHSMALIGFGYTQYGDIVYEGSGPNDPDIIIDEFCPFLNQEHWIFKNSYDYIQISNPNSSYYPFFEVSCSVNDLGYPNYIKDGLSTNYFSLSHQCTDEDGDGYFWWGLGPRWETCPEPTENGVFVEEDCDDFNPNVGPYNMDPDHGFLYECSPLCTFDNNPLYIHESQTWNDPRHFNRNIIIETGYSLTINATITFSPLARIIVQPGATLQINSEGILTTSEYCDGLWGGIQLMGNPFMPQDPYGYQGKVIVYGTIKNAWYGIRTFIPGCNPDGGGGVMIEEGCPTGGIIHVDGGKFINNKTAIRFYPYNRNNISYIQDAEFTTNAPLTGNFNPECFIRMDGVSGIKITNCTFQNLRPKNENPFGQRGKGIYCFNTNMEFPSTSNTNYFNSLDYGIYLINGASASISKINNCVFQNNLRGLYLDGFREISTVDIQDNQFLRNGSSWFVPDGTSYMLYLNNCSGYKVHGNNFEVDPSIYGYSDTYIGIIVRGSGEENNYIYHNNFTNLTVSIQSQNQNRQDAEPSLTGLRILCNNYNNPKSNVNSDVKVTYDDSNNGINGIAHDQKNMDPYIYWPTQEPAGNTFTLYPGSNHYDVDIDPDASVNWIEYYHHPSIPFQYKLEPTLFPDPNNPKVHKTPRPWSYVPATSCLENYYPPLGGEVLKLLLNQSDNKIDSLQSILSLLIDAGSTDTLNTEVITSTYLQSYDIYQELINASPYLSDTVLKSSIIKEDVLPNVMMRDIMVVNPHSGKNDELLTALDNRLNPMPDSLWNDILEAADSLGQKEILESHLSSWIQKKDMCFNGLIENYRYDTINIFANDSLVLFLENENSLKARYNLIYFFISLRNFQEANNILQVIPTIFNLSSRESMTHQKMTTLLPILTQLYIDSLGFLKPDSIQTITLFQLISDVDDLPGNFARNILLANGLITYDEPIVIGTALKSFKKPHRVNRINTDNSFIKIYPNPCSSYLIVEYLNKDDNYTGFLELKNILGNCLYSTKIINGYYQNIIPLMDLEPGVYYLYFISTTGKKDVKKIIKSN